MAGRVLTDADFQEGGEPKDKDTSLSIEPKDKPIPADEVIKVGEDKAEEPEKKEEPSEAKEEPQPKPSEEPPKYKHKTWEETERARIEAERKMHEATTKASEYERKLTQYERPREPVITIDDRIKEMTKETLNKIRLLPTDSVARDDDAGYLWAKLQSDITDVKYEERTRRDNTERDVVKRTYDTAVKEGIKTDAELRILGYEFSKTDPSARVEDRISRAVDNTKDILSQIRNGFVEKQELDKKEKDDLKVLGRGSSRPEKSEKKEDKPLSMSQQLAELNERRRLKKDDLYR